ncbi:MAG: hypothetical protein ACXWTP_00320 [Methylosarcina sp.]
MNANQRLIAIITFNLIIVVGMLKYLLGNGIDLEKSSLIDHANNIWFIFDFLNFLIISFLIDFVILSYPSKNRRTINKLLQIIEEKKTETQSHKLHRKKIA